MPKTGKIFYGPSSIKTDQLNKLYEVDATYPPISPQKQVIFVQDFTLNNDGVTTSMKVNGSVTTQKFIVQPDLEDDVIISSLSFFINASLTTTDLGEFGGTTSLTNGCRLLIETSDNGDIVIADQIKTNYDLLRMAQGNPALGFAAGGSEFKVANVVSNSDEGFLFILRFQDYGFDKDYVGGIRLRKNTNDRLIFEIRDNLNLAPSSLESFDAVAYGYKRLT